MNLTINTFPGFSFFFPANTETTRRTVAQPRVVEALSSLQQLQKGAILVIDPAAHAQVLCLEGTLWITHDGCIKDIVVEAGEHYIASSSARMLVQALEHSQLQLI